MTPFIKPLLVSDLDVYRTVQAHLFAALVAFHRDGGPLHAHGLAIYHRSTGSGVEAILVHVDGGEISSGPVLDGDLTFDAGTASSMLTGALSVGVQVAVAVPETQTPDPLAGGEITIFGVNALHPPAEPEPAADRLLTEDEREAVLSLFDRMVELDKAALKTIGIEFRAHFGLGNTPLVKAFTTLEHAQWLTDRITPLL